MQRWVGLLAAAVVAAPGAALAQSAPVPPPAPQGAPPPGPAAPPRAVVLLVDGSDAMLAPLPEGRPRIDAVRDAVARAATDLPEGAVVGLRLAGPDAAVAPPGCADTRPLTPVAPLDRVAIGSALAPPLPAGPSSTAEGLRGAVDDLPANADSTVVLVAARLGGCVPGETCGAARELLDRGVGLRVDAVGVAPDPATLQELRCVTEATGGALAVADTTPALVSAVTRTALRALSPLAQTTVQPVRRDAAVAVTLPPGAHADVLRPAEPRRYLVDLTEGAELLVSVSASAPPELADRVVLRLSVGEDQQDAAAVLLGSGRQTLRVRTGPVAGAGTAGGPASSHAADAATGSTATGAGTSPDPTGARAVPVDVVLEQFAGGVLPGVDVPVLLDLDVVDTLVVVEEAPEPVVQRLPAPPPEQVVVVRDRVPTWMWGLLAALTWAVIALGSVLATPRLPSRRRPAGG